MNVREIFEYTRDGKDMDGNPVENKLTLETGNIQWSRFAWVFERNAYVYVKLAEYAKEYASHIKGKVTDSEGKSVPGANLNLSKDVYNTMLAEGSTDVVFWNPVTHTAGQEGPASTATAANRKPDWTGVNWAQFAPWGHGVNTNTANLDPALVNHAADIQAWFRANPPKSRYYDDIYNYVHPITGDTFRTIRELQTGSIDIQSADGTYDWSVVPSQQPETYAFEGRMQPNWTGGNATNQRRGTAGGFEVTSATDPRIGTYIYQDKGYDIVAKAPGYYDSSVANVIVEEYKLVKDNVNFELAEAIKADYDFSKYRYRKDDNSIPFSTFVKDIQSGDSVKGVVNGATVYATVNDQPVEVVSLGNGDYKAVFNANKDLRLGDDDDVDLVIDFKGGQPHSAFTATFKLVDRFVIKHAINNGIISAALTNNIDLDQNMSIVVAVYDDNSALKVIDSKAVIVNKFSKGSVILDKDFSNFAGFKYKVFLWDSKTLAPLCELFEGIL
jgi:hypothetical protein